MKKTLIIILGISVLLLALLAWGYLFLFGTPETSEEFFADLGFTVSGQPTVPLPVEEVPFTPPEAVVDVAGSPLRQITFRPVAGFIGLTGEETPKVRYTEKGSGHVYDINLETGEERRISNTTNARVVHAVFNNSGSKLVLQTETGYFTNSLAASIDEPGTDGRLTTRSLPPNIENVSFIDENTVHFTASNPNGTTGYEYSFDRQQQTTVYTAPFLSVTSQKSDTSYFITNRYAPELSGNLFNIAGNNFEAQLQQKFGLLTVPTPSHFIYSYNENNEVLSESYSRSSSEITQLPLPIIPEKCVASRINSDQLYCGAPLTQVPDTYIKEWYQGAIRSNDALWQISLSAGEARLIANPPTEVGREVDITFIAYLPNESSLLFINKSDDTLWQYDFLAE